MAEGEEKLTGLAKYFNSQTMSGRANVSDLTSKLWTTFVQESRRASYL